MAWPDELGEPKSRGFAAPQCGSNSGVIVLAVGVAVGIPVGPEVGAVVAVGPEVEILVLELSKLRVCAIGHCLMLATVFPQKLSCNIVYTTESFCVAA